MHNQIIESINGIPDNADVVGVSYTVCTCSIRVHVYYEIKGDNDIKKITVYSEPLSVSCKRGSDKVKTKGLGLVRSAKDCLSRVRSQMSLSWELSLGDNHSTNA